MKREEIVAKVKKLMKSEVDDINPNVIVINNPLEKIFGYLKADDQIINANSLLDYAKNEITSIKGVAETQMLSGYTINRGWRSYSIICKLVIFLKPCKEFLSLKKYLSKYAKYDLQLTTFYYKNIWGKRNSEYTKSENYLAYSPSACKDILAWLGANKATTCKIVVEEDYHFYRDEENYVREIEWNGLRYNDMKVSLCPKKTDKIKTAKSFTLR